MLLLLPQESLLRTLHRCMQRLTWGTLLLGIQAVALSKEATVGWSAGSMQGRQCALAASKRAAEASELCHKELISVFKMNA